MACVVLSATLSATAAGSECIRVELDVPAALRGADVVFSGTVAEVDFIKDRLRFRVDRVWSGPVGRDMWIHQLDPPFIGSHVFRPHSEARYIIFARELSREERRFRAEPDEPAVFGIHATCGEGPRRSQDHARQLDRIAKGAKPRK